MAFFHLIIPLVLYLAGPPRLFSEKADRHNVIPEPGARNIPFAVKQTSLAEPLILEVWKERVLENGGVHEWTSDHDGMRVFQEWVSLLELNRNKPASRKKKIGSDLEDYVVYKNMRSLSRIGTSIPLPGSPKADFDMSLLGCITLLGLFQHDTLLLTNRTYIHLLQNVTHLWGQEPKNYFDVLMLSFQETENHVFMIETTRYLTNQFIWENPRNLLQITELKDSLQASDLVLNNENGLLYTLLLKQMHQILKSGYFEFNAKVYQRFTVHALNNLFSFSSDSTIIKAAQNVLDYTAAKFLFQSYHSIRLGPYRRNAEKYRNDETFIDDAVTSFYGIQSGKFPYTGSELKKFWKENVSHASSALFSAVLKYRIPDVLMDMWQDNKVYWARMRTRHKFNRRHESTPECYLRTPRFLVTCGGRYKFYQGANFPIKVDIQWDSSPWVYDITSRSSSIVWAPGDSYTLRIPRSVIKFKGHQWNSNNLTAYKNFIYGFGKRSIPPVKPSIETPFELPVLLKGKRYTAFENNNFFFRLYNVPEKGVQVIMTVLKEKKTWFKYRYQKFSRGTLEILDADVTGPFKDVVEKVKSQNSGEKKRVVYTMYNGERLWLNPKFTGKKNGILKIEAPVSAMPVATGVLEYQGAGLYGIDLKEDQMPLMVVHEMNPASLTPERMVAYADGEGLLVIKNHQLKKELYIDFSAWWHPGRKTGFLQEP